MWIPFISSSSLIAIGRTSKTMLNNSGENGHPCLVPDLTANAFSFFTIDNNVCCRLIIYDLYYVEVGSFCAHFWGVLIINGCWVLSKAFSASIEMIIWFWSFNLLTWSITLIDFHILKNPCIPGINTTWSWCMSFLMCCWICLLEFCWVFLHLCSSVILACRVFFFCLWFWYQGDSGLVEWVWKCSFLCSFLKEF